jgi:3',5'-nucleoside bisphosphate phosphatase
MAQFRSDLHMHSHISDGQLSPTELMRSAARGGLHAVSLTDHDTAGGIAEARRAAHEEGIHLIPGIEISTVWEVHEFHILGYWIDPDAASILDHQDRALGRRKRRMEKMVLRLQEMGIPVTFEEVVEAAGPGTHALGRPHLARALFAGGHTRYHGEAFTRFIGDGGPAFVAEDFPTPLQGIQRIHDAGGLAFWAHPPLDIFASMLPQFLDWGLDGMECFRPSLTGAEMQLLEHSARQYGLMTSGGSDWHGPHRAMLGDFALRLEDVSQLLSFGGIVGPSSAEPETLS